MDHPAQVNPAHEPAWTHANNLNGATDQKVDDPSPKHTDSARHARRFQPEHKHVKVDDRDMEQQKDQPVPEPPESQRNLTVTLIEAAAAYKTVDKVLDVVVPDAYEGIKHAAKAGMEKVRGSKEDPPSAEGSAE